MIPASVSATSLEVARECPARYKAEHIDYARGWQNPPAMLGSVLHSALEKYVDDVYVTKIKKASAAYLHDLYELYFTKYFGLDHDSEDLFTAGEEMCETWSEREKWHMTDGRQIVSLEQKKHIFIETSVGPVKLNFILDRFDKIGENKYEIIDYKSQYKNLKDRDLKKKLQPWIYAIAQFIEHPDAELMLVTFDMLRYDHTTIEITKADARAMFEEICRIIEEDIIAIDGDNPPEKLNLSCNYCIRKAGCATLKKNIDAGGLFSLTLEQQIDLRTQVEMQVKGLQQLQKDLDEVVEVTLGKDLKMELDTSKSRAFFTTKQFNKIKSIDDARKIVGDEIFERYAKTTITLEQYKKMIKDPALNDEQRAQLKAQMTKEYGDPKLNYENKRGELENQQYAAPPTGTLKPAAAAAPILGLD